MFLFILLDNRRSPFTMYLLYIRERRIKNIKRAAEP
jgi:hypothetical protein